MKLILSDKGRPYKAPLAQRVECLLKRGGHHLYFNKELGGLWCFHCGSVWSCDPPVSGK